MEKEKFIKHTFRLLPIYEQAQLDNDYSNYLQSIDYSLSEMSDFIKNPIIAKVCECLNEIRDIDEYSHSAVRKIVFYCCKRLSSL